MVRLQGLPWESVMLSLSSSRYYAPLRLPLSWLSPDRGGPLQFPDWTLPAFRVPYAGGFLAVALPRASPLPWPSPFATGLGSLLAARGGRPLRVVLTTRQTSRNATDCRIACLLDETLSAGFDGGISPAAAAQLPGGWVPTRTGLAPASPTWLSGHTSETNRNAPGRTGR
jgi:hypothetical protein